jgi:ABC-type methionine transport system permease subunit
MNKNNFIMCVLWLIIGSILGMVIGIIIQYINRNKEEKFKVMWNLNMYRSIAFGLLLAMLVCLGLDMRKSPEDVKKQLMMAFKEYISKNN